MDNKKSLEESLGSVNAGPGERVKHSVMNAYTAGFQSEHDKNIWDRAVPLYKAVAAAIMLALISALTGGYIVSSTQERQSAPAYVKNSEAMAAAQFKPVIAESDAF
jgi:hypothetical protein